MVAYKRHEQIIKNLINLNKKKVDLNIIVSIDWSEDQLRIVRYIEALSLDLNIEIIKHDKNLGLKKHILSCGDLLVERDYFSLIVIEDDIELSPFFDGYVHSALPLCDTNIAGVSLYSYDICELNSLCFRPFNDGYDNYFMQFPSSWGQLWTQPMWIDFRYWLEVNDCDYFNDKRLPDAVNNWPKTSWKKHFLRYMVDQDKYFMYPRISLTSNTGADGSNHNSIYDKYKVDILNGNKKWNITSYDNSQSIYSSRFGFDKLTITEMAYMKYRENPLSFKEYLCMTYFALKDRLLK
jgi:hypothetical protein